ncbi:DNA polymerase I (plasmid) [Legionella adelaidensis]|uniref:DNA polymerase I n=1 Tax=Legionella adelaidensis TaxID=45056 RepID=A0A0W0R0U6_9GAMM|nr:DNA polymerase I [Legionella adelaidensis]KTC64653.1 DNA polymerase I [Legionella adelaidensis]VEH86121.1 DNA polymerase I [Legionella adelaidensis]
MTSPLVLVDASSYFFRAFHALPPLVTSKGQPTGAVYGVANMIKKLIKDYQPQQIAVVFDAAGKTFRDEWYPEYKANRQAMPNELSCQFKPLLSLLEAMGLPLLTIEGVEADDVIGTLATQATLQNIPVVISTGDKDFAQLVNENVILINTMTNVILNPATVKEKFGVAPQQIIDYLTLVGDATDNIPGVNKCGPKTAAKWLADFQTLDELIAHADKITGKIGENLRDSLRYLPLSKKLVTIRTDVSLPITIADLTPKAPHRERLIQFVRDLEFRNWLKELLEEEEKTSAELKVLKPQEINYELVTNQSQFQYLLQTLTECSVFAFDIKTNNEFAMCAEIIGFTFATEAEKSFYIPVKHLVENLSFTAGNVIEKLKPIFENPTIKKIGHNLKYSYIILKNHDVNLLGIESDTMLESYVLNSTAVRHDIDSLSLKYLGYKTISFNDVVGSGAKQLRLEQIPLEPAGQYAAEDSQIILRLHKALYSLLDEKLKRVLHEIEIPLLTVLGNMERKGVLIDKGALERHGERLKVKMADLEKEAWDLAGKPFNLNSPKQLLEIFYHQQNLPVLAKTPTGQPSTAEAVLQELAYEYRLPAVILEYRSLSKLVSTYIDSLPKCINEQTQRVHTNYNQAVAATGRLSSSEPNLQNIPIRNDEGRLIRKTFKAAPNHVILAADYSQIELRIMAHLSQDPNLLKAFSLGLDIHTATASEIFDTSLEKVTSEQRRSAKAVNFGLIYGMSSFGLAKQIGVERQVAQEYIDRYFTRYPGVLEYMERTRKQAHQQGYVETVFGRRLHLPEINTRNLMRQRAAERMAINAPMQGTAADIIKKAMIAIGDWQEKEQPNACMIMQVHDELVFEVLEKEVEQIKPYIQKLMENTVELSVPLVVSIGYGSNWDEAH